MHDGCHPFFDSSRASFHRIFCASGVAVNVSSAATVRRSTRPWGAPLRSVPRRITCPAVLGTTPSFSFATASPPTARITGPSRLDPFPRDPLWSVGSVWMTSMAGRRLKVKDSGVLVVKTGEISYLCNPFHARSQCLFGFFDPIMIVKRHKTKTLESLL